MGNYLIFYEFDYHKIINYITILQVWGYDGAALVRMADLLPTITDRTQENILLENIRKSHVNRLKPHIVDLTKECPSAKDVQHSYLKFRDLCVPDSVRLFKVQDFKFYALLDSTKWLQHVSTCLTKANEAASKIYNEKATVVLQEGQCEIYYVCIHLHNRPLFRNRFWSRYELYRLQSNTINNRSLLEIYCWISIVNTEGMGGIGTSVRIPVRTRLGSGFGSVAHIPLVFRLRVAAITTISYGVPIQRDLSDDVMGFRTFVHIRNVLVQFGTRETLGRKSTFVDGYRSIDYYFINFLINYFIFRERYV